VRLPGVGTATSTRLLVEIGCGLRPRLPLERALFVDVSRTACTKLGRAGARAVCGTIEALPFPTGGVDAAHAYELLEHVEDDAAAVRELGRVLVAGGLLVISTPLHPARMDTFDRVVGHARRYDPATLVALMTDHGFALDGFAPFGLRPRSWLLGLLGVYYLTRQPRLALQYEERFLRRRHAPDAPVLIQQGSEDDFVREAVRLDGAVTAWRRM